MTKILVRPDDLQVLSEWFVQTAGQMRQIGVRMGAVPSGLDWQVREAVGIEQQALGARSRALALADQCDAMAKFLRTRAGLFRAADGRGLGEMAVTAAEYRDIMEGHQMGGSGPDGRNAARHLRTGAVAGGVAATLPVMGAVGLLERENPGLFGPPPGPTGDRLPTPAETRFIQRVLGVDEDGYGPKTRAAVAAFQRAHGIPVDGKVMIGPRTWRALLGADAQVPGSTSPGTEAVPEPTWPEPSKTVGIRNPDFWDATDAPLKSHSGNRSPERYAAVIDQFEVASNPRYAPRNGDTFCNIFVWDATRAMGAEIPHVVDGTGELTRGAGDALDANGIASWLAEYGETHGWHEVSPAEAQAWANQGQPVVAALHNPKGIGHVAMVRPGEYDVTQGPAIAQAGAKNMNQTTVRIGFTVENQGAVRYWVHD